jgi:hypothetical protein
MNGRPIELWLDDCRDPTFFGHSGWFWVTTAAEAINVLSTGRVTIASFDHDLGFLEDGEDEESGYDVICWLESNPEFWPPEGVSVHSSNPVGAARMQQVIDRHYKKY